MSTCNVRTVAVLVVCALIAGCADTMKRKQLEKVAKDWSLVIRASQVIPVYPLTEDLQPGDVFLVLTSIPNQAKAYEEKGFLPLDQHLTRLVGLDFGGFYGGSYGIGDHTDTPRHWQFPAEALRARAAAEAAGGALVAGGGADDNETPVKHLDPTEWHLAPRSAFPTYTFSVESGGGIQAALPLQGIPIGLSLMNTDSASGSATIADTYTYGVALDDLVDDVTAWAGTPEHLAMLRSVRVAAGQPIFLRVVSRVYLTGRVVVGLSSATAGGAQVTAGNAPERSIADLDSKSATAYTDTLGTLSKGINATLPGGKLELAWASSRSVAMSETFDRPLVIGYLGFDFPIFDDGALGAPVSTRNHLLGRPEPEARVGEFTSTQTNLRILLLAIASRSPADQDAIYDRAAAALDPAFTATYQENRQAAAGPPAFSSARSAFEMQTEDELFTEKVYAALLDAWTVLAP